MADVAADLPCHVHKYIVHLPAMGWFPDRGHAAHSCSHPCESATPQSLLELQSDSRGHRKPSYDLDAGKV